MEQNLNPNIFLSYSWLNVAIADEIDADFKSLGIEFRRDIRDAPYRTSIKEFMHQVGQSDFVLMIISDEYLRSENCMYEVTELLNTHEFEKRILPIIIDNASHIFKPLNQTIYYDYWNDKKREADKFNKRHANEVSLEYSRKCQNIKENISKFFQKITDLNVSTYQKLKDENYRDLLTIIGFRNEFFIEEILRIGQIEDQEVQELELEDFLKKYPNNKYGMFRKAFLANETNQYKKAKKYYEDTIAIYPTYLNAHNNLANILKKNFSDFETAKLHYEAAIVLDVNSFTPRYNYANLLKDDILDFENAKLQYEEAIKLNPNYLSAHMNLAILLKNNFLDFSGAKKHYEEALKIDPSHSKTHFNLALLLEKKFSDFKNARHHYIEATRINPKYKRAYSNLAILMETQFLDFQLARYYYEEALKIDPDYKMARNNLNGLLKDHF